MSQCYNRFDTILERQEAPQVEHVVFISHSVKDKDQQATEAVYDYLQANGIRCFMDRRDLIPGDTYHTQLATALRESKLVVLVLSQNSDDSDAVGREMAIAKNNKIPVIPLRIEDVIPRKLEFFITTSQWLDAFPPPIERYLPRLVDAIGILLGGDTGKQSRPQVAGVAPAPKTQEVPSDPPDFTDWVEIDSPPEWITADRRLLKALNEGKVMSGKSFLYRYNQRARCYQKRLK